MSHWQIKSFLILYIYIFSVALYSDQYLNLQLKYILHPQEAPSALEKRRCVHYDRYKTTERSAQGRARRKRGSLSPGSVWDGSWTLRRCLQQLSLSWEIVTSSYSSYNLCFKTKKKGQHACIQSNPTFRCWAQKLDFFFKAWFLLAIFVVHIMEPILKWKSDMYIRYHLK